VSFQNRFRWSGNNSNRARHDATIAFANYLADDIDQHHGCRHYIIAHSHGGNIVLHGLERLTDAQREAVGGIMTLGTPFLWFEAWKQGRLAGWIRSMAVTYSGILIAAPILALIPAGVTAIVDLLQLPEVWALPAALGCVVLGAIPLIRLALGTEERQRIALQFGPPRQSVGLPWLVVRTPGDEASSAVRMAEIPSRLGSGVWAQSSRLFTFDGRGRALVKVLAVFVLAYLLDVLLPFSELMETDRIAELPAAGADWYVLQSVIAHVVDGSGALLVFALILATILTAAVTVPLVFAFGPDTYGLALLVRVLVEDTPPHRKATVESLPAVPNTMRHAVTARPELIDTLGSWIEDRESGRRW
jgi:hypothetical protein